MAAEVHHLSVEGHSVVGIQSRIVGEGRTFHTDGYGDGAGHETFVKVRGDGDVEIFNGSVISRSGEDEGACIRIKHHEKVAALKPGDPGHTEKLIGPHNNNRVLMYVRNLGNAAAAPFVEQLPTDPPLMVNLN